MKLHSFCSYPYGGWVTFGLLAACMGAVATTTYAVASCHFVVVEFVSQKGGFEDLFGNRDGAGSTLQQYKVGAGLFTWLQPKDVSDWSNGQCTGYTERARDVIADPTFEAARFMGVFVVLFGLVMMIWAFLLTCMTFQSWQQRIFQAMTLLLTVMAGLTYLINKSALCQDVGQDTKCKLDEGGLVNIAGAMLWFVAFLISLVFIQDPNEKALVKKTARQNEKTRAFARSERKRQREEEKLKRQEERDNLFALEEEAKLAVAAEQALPPSTPNTIDDDASASSERYSNDPGESTIEQAEEEGQFEVYIGNFLDKIEKIVDV